MKAVIYTCLLLLIFCMSSDAVYYTEYTTLQSMISNNVYYTYKDSRGYMWFATDKGISRFDGRKFKHYTTLDGIGDNEVFRLYEDKAKRMWLFTYNGSACYLRNDSVFNAGNDPLLKKMPLISFINTMYSVDDTTLYIGYRFGEVVKISGNKVTHMHRESHTEELTAILPINGSMHIMGRDSIFTIAGDKLVNARPANGVKWKYHNDILFGAHKAGLKLFCNGKLQWEYDDKALTLDYVIDMSSDAAGNIFVSTTNGLHVINQATKQKIVLFRGQRISNVEQDICGNYWVASFGNGSYCINRELEKLVFVRKIENAVVYPLSESQFFLRQNDSLYNFRNGQLVKETLPYRFTANCQPLYADDSLLFFTNPGLQVYNKKTGVIQFVANSPKWVFAGKDKFILVTRYIGIIHYLKIKKNVPWIYDTLTADGVIRDAKKSPFNNSIYLLTDSSLIKIDEEKTKLQMIGHLPEDQKIINMHCVDNYIVLLSNANSLVVYDIAANYKRISVSTGNISVYNLANLGGNRYLTYDGSIYYTLSISNSGIPRINLQKIEYPFRSAHLLNIYPVGDRLLCLVNGNLYSISKDLVNKQSDRPVFSIKKIIVNGRLYHIQNITVANAARGYINLSLSTLHFNNFNNSYQYRIHSREGAGPWYRSNDDDLHIVIPEYGDYRLELRAIAANNKISPSVYLNIVLEPPFYYMAWFKGLILLFATGCIIYCIYLYNMQRKKIFQNRLNHLKLEQRTVSSLLNPHFTFNAINNIQNLVNEHETDRANGYLAVLSKLIRQNMENLQFSLIPVGKELELVSNYIYLQNLRFNDKIKMSICNQLPAAYQVNIPPLLIHTFVENAVVHGFAQHLNDFTITIDISLSVDDYLIISIHDNGLGLKHANKDYAHLHDKLSMGIEITKTRLERLSQFYKVKYSIDIKGIDEGDETGTEVTITLYSKFMEPAM